MEPRLRELEESEDKPGTLALRRDNSEGLSRTFGHANAGGVVCSHPASSSISCPSSAASGSMRGVPKLDKDDVGGHRPGEFRFQLGLTTLTILTGPACSSNASIPIENRAGEIKRWTTKLHRIFAPSNTTDPCSSFDSSNRAAHGETPCSAGAPRPFERTSIAAGSALYRPGPNGAHSRLLQRSNGKNSAFPEPSGETILPKPTASMV